MQNTFRVGQLLDSGAVVLELEDEVNHSESLISCRPKEVFYKGEKLSWKMYLERREKDLFNFLTAKPKLNSSNRLYIMSSFDFSSILRKTEWSSEYQKELKHFFAREYYEKAMGLTEKECIEALAFYHIYL